MRVVVYSEGTAESAARHRQIPAPGEPLPQDQIGAAHILVRKALEREWPDTRGKVSFLAPLLRKRGGHRPRLARGSDLLDISCLHQLIIWPSPDRQPDLTVVVVDQDGVNQRKSKITADVEDRIRKNSSGGKGQLFARWLLAVAKQEFESWLLSDPSAVATAYETPVAERDFEALAPGVAKSILMSLKGRTDEEHNPVRHRKIAEALDIERLRQNCSSFADFLQDLKRLKS